MRTRYAALWFEHLLPDYTVLKQPELKGKAFVLARAMHGSLISTAVSVQASQEGVRRGMSVADAKAFLPSLEVIEEQVDLHHQLLEQLAFWCIRYTPVVAIDGIDGLLLDITGCAHLWGGEEAYAKDLRKRLYMQHGFQTRIAIANTIGAAWALSRFGTPQGIYIDSPTALLQTSLADLPPEALRIEPILVQQLYKLGFRRLGDFSHMPAPVLRRRFGDILVQRLRQAFGQEVEFVQAVKPPIPYTESYPCLEPVRTAEVIELCVKTMLTSLCRRLDGEGRGLREATLYAYRLDGKQEKISIHTSKASAQLGHLLKLFALRIPEITPALGIELFVLEALRVEELDQQQESLWEESIDLADTEISELIDRLKTKQGTLRVQRFLPDQHYWPERSMRVSSSLNEVVKQSWKLDRPRPLRLLPSPERIEVTAPIPDYPPMSFRYKGQVHLVKKADGPERIEREWWIDQGEHRDYYYVEDEVGQRYWIFRLGHYGNPKKVNWFLHGFFA